MICYNIKAFISKGAAYYVRYSYYGCCGTYYSISSLQSGKSAGVSAAFTGGSGGLNLLVT